MRIVIDIDGTICETKKHGQTYEDLRVNPGAVKKIRQLKKDGHYIILHSARHMKSTNGNVKLVVKKIGPVTEKWLNKNGIVYDEIHFGKPYNQVLIDDRAFVFEGWPGFKPENFDHESLNIVINCVSWKPAALQNLAVWSKGLLKELVSVRKRNLIFIIPYKQTDLAAVLKKTLGKTVQVIFCPSKIRGEIEQIFLARYLIDNFQRLLIFTAAITFKSKFLEYAEDNLEGIIGVSSQQKTPKHFVINDFWGYAGKILSKNKAKSLPVAGLFYFNNGRDFISCATAAIRNKNEWVGETCNYLIERGQKVKTADVTNFY